MYKKLILALVCAIFLVVALPLLQSQPPGRGQSQPAAAVPANPAPGILPSAGPPPGAGRGPSSSPNVNAGLSVIPYPMYNELVYRQAYDVIFNRANLDGWHVSRNNFHGSTPNFFVTNMILIGGQNPYGLGGILMSDKKYKNFDLYLEVKPDWGCDGGVFVRSAEDGSTYQVTIDYLPGGSVGAVIAERIAPIGPPRPDPSKLSPEEREKQTAEMRQRNSAWQKVWKREDWNAMRIKVEGAIPHIQVWINDTLISDFQDTANHAKDGAESGNIGLQVHGHTDRWLAGGFHRWRVIAVKELP